MALGAAFMCLHPVLPSYACVPDMACTSCYLRSPENLSESLPLRPSRFLDMACTTCPKNCLEMFGNQAVCLTRSDASLHIVPRNCSEMPENHVESLSWPERISNKASTLCPRNCLKMPKNQASSLEKACTPYPKNYLEMPKNQVASVPWLRHIPDMARKSCPRNYLEMPENKGMSLPRPGHGLHTVSQKLPRNA
ncbi:Hypothetical predicted protein [Olea europaea subsp. europaea]|uniref:Uncharacterized protein n=1 Tax=Olea europaea subsp. europaea TaxID=158383 RepID=A0A8S0PMB5_OLEEU|nr:Hypothetical predicted protein [Olea europaea subsp. europaea]